MANLTSAIRRAIVKKLTEDTALATLMGGTVRVSYRPTRRPLTLPIITMFDFADRADEITPTWDRNHQLDVWHSDLDQAEEIAQRVKELLDHQGLALAGDEGQVDRIHMVGETDATQEDADLVRKTIRLRIMATDYTTTYNNN
jgi:hypothetical protein